MNQNFKSEKERNSIIELKDKQRQCRTSGIIITIIQNLKNLRGHLIPLARFPDEEIQVYSSEMTSKITQCVVSSAGKRFNLQSSRPHNCPNLQLPDLLIIETYTSFKIWYFNLSHPVSLMIIFKLNLITESCFMFDIQLFCLFISSICHLKMNIPIYDINQAQLPVFLFHMI